MLSVSGDVFKYNLSPYLGPKDILHLSETCTQLLSYYPAETRQEISYKLRLEYAESTFNITPDSRNAKIHERMLKECFNVIRRVHFDPITYFDSVFPIFLYKFALKVLECSLFTKVLFQFDDEFVQKRVTNLIHFNAENMETRVLIMTDNQQLQCGPGRVVIKFKSFF